MASSELNMTDAGSSHGTPSVKAHVRKVRNINDVPWVAWCVACPYREHWWFHSDAIDQAAHHVWVWHR